MNIIKSNKFAKILCVILALFALFSACHQSIFAYFGDVNQYNDILPPAGEYGVGDGENLNSSANGGSISDGVEVAAIVILSIIAAAVIFAAIVTIITRSFRGGED